MLSLFHFHCTFISKYLEIIPIFSGVLVVVSLQTIIQMKAYTAQKCIHRMKNEDEEIGDFGDRIEDVWLGGILRFIFHIIIFLGHITKRSYSAGRA